MSVVKRVQKLTRRIASVNSGKVNANRSKLARLVRTLRTTKYSKGASMKGSLRG